MSNSAYDKRNDTRCDTTKKTTDETMNERTNGEAHAGVAEGHGSNKTAYKKRVAVFFGGKSSEHSISCVSGYSVLSAIDKDKYDVIPVAISKSGKWYYMPDYEYLSKDFSSLDAVEEGISDEDKKKGNLKSLTDERLVKDGFRRVSLQIGTYKKGVLLFESDSCGCADVTKGIDECGAGNGTKCGTETDAPIKPTGKIEFDVAFPVLHGLYGEDGKIQGILEYNDIPIAGCSMTGSVLAIDKAICKIVVEAFGIETADFVLIRKGEQRDSIKNILKDFTFPLFVKPVCQGSSIGITKIDSLDELDDALDIAFEFDKKVIVEQGIQGREIECAVYGYKDLIPTRVGEIICKGDDFYDFDKKYVGTEQIELKVPTQLDDDVLKSVQNVAIKVFKALDLSGMARIDCFLVENESEYKIILNEVNTIPGFTSISMYPTLCEDIGISYKDLVGGLIDNIE